MPFTVRRAHNLGIDRARRMAEEAAGRLGKDLGLRHHWEGDRLVFRGLPVRGYIDIDASSVEIHVITSLFLPVSSARLQQAVTEELDRAIERASEKPST